MFHGTLALLNQTLRTDSRRITAHLFMLIFVGLIFIMMLQSSFLGAFMGAPGLWLFSSISWLNLFFILFAGVGFFSSAITEEKEEQTLGLLKMTGLSPLILLLGKSTSRLIFALLLLSVQIPFTQLSVTLGGVSMAQIIAVYVALGSFTIMVANIGLFFSVVSRNTRTSATAMILFYLSCLTCVLTGYGVVAQNSLAYPILWPIVQFLGEESIVYRLTRILATGFASEYFTPQVWFNLIIGGVFFLLSWMMFDRSTASADSANAAPVRTDFLKKKKGGGKKYAGRAWHLALSWKDFHFQAGGVTTIIVKFLLYGAIYFGIMVYNASYWRWPDQDEVGAWLMFGSICFILLEAVIYAGALFKEEIRWQTLSILVMLPRSVAQIAYEKIFGYLWAFIPAVSYFLLGAALAPEIVIEALEEILLSDSIAFLAFTLSILTFVTFLHLVTFMSLYVKYGAIFVSMAVAWAVGVCYMFILSMIIFQSGSSGDEVFVVLTLILQAIVCLVLHILIGERLKTLASR